MINVVSFSGGRTSAYLVYLMEKRRKKTGERVEYIFMDTGAEHPETYKFVRNLVKYWNIPLVCLRVIPNPEKGKASTYESLSVNQIGPDLEPWKRMVQKYGHPYIGGGILH